MFGSKHLIGSDFGGIYGRPWVVSDGVVGEVEAQALQGRSVAEPCQALDGRTAQPLASSDTEKSPGWGIIGGRGTFADDTTQPHCLS